MIKRVIPAVISLIIIMNISFGESINIELETAKSIALKQNPGVKLAREGVKKLDATVTEARSGLFPSVSAFSSLQHAWELPTIVIDFPGVGRQAFKMGSENTVASGINISQPLFTGGAIWTGYRMSMLSREIAHANLKSVEQNTVYQVTNAYYGVLFAKSAVAVAKQALESAEENLLQVTKFYNAGKSSRFDVLRAEVQMANFKPMVVSSTNQLKLAESGLRLVLGMENDKDFNYTEELRFDTSDLTEKNLDELIEIALQERPEVIILNNQKKMALRQLTLARSSFMPSLLFGTNYQYQGLRDDFEFTKDDFYKSFNSTLSISIPLFNGFKNSANIQKARIGITESNHQEESLNNAIRVEVKTAFYKIKEAKENVLTQQKTIEQAEEALKLANLMYSEGSSTQLDVLNANLALNQAKMNYTKSLFEYNVAIASLKKAISH